MSDQQRFPSSLALLIGIGALEALLLGIAGPPPSHLQVLAELASPLAEPLEGMLAALALAAEALAAYLVLALALRTLTHLPGFAGRVADHAERVLTIPAVRRGFDALLGGALIAHLALAPASTGPEFSTAQARSPAIATAAAIQHDRWPDSARRAAPESRKTGIAASTTARASVPLPIWLGGVPTLGAATSSSRSHDLTARQGSVDGPRRAAASVPPPAIRTGHSGPVSATEDSDPPRTGPAKAYHTIESGETLWSIAMRHLPREAMAEASIARYWRRIYSANRGAIGPDPNRIHPGVTLFVPPRPASTAPSPSSGSACTSMPAWPQSSARTDDPPDPLP